MALAAPPAALPAPSTFTARGMRGREVVVSGTSITHGNRSIPLTRIRMATVRKVRFTHSAYLVLLRYRDLTPGLRLQRRVVRIRLSRADAEAALRCIQRREG